METAHTAEAEAPDRVRAQARPPLVLAHDREAVNGGVDGWPD